MTEALAYPFMQRALAAGAARRRAAGLLGVLVILRRAAFFGDAVAHASLAGIALGVVAGLPPLLLAAAVAVGIGLSLHRFERMTRLSLDPSSVSSCPSSWPSACWCSASRRAFSPSYSPTSSAASSR